MVNELCCFWELRKALGLGALLQSLANWFITECLLTCNTRKQSTYAPWLQGFKRGVWDVSLKPFLPNYFTPHHSPLMKCSDIKIKKKKKTYQSPTVWNRQGCNNSVQQTNLRRWVDETLNNVNSLTKCKQALCIKACEIWRKGIGPFDCVFFKKSDFYQ